jgi:uncharacterized protein YggL (DUF469 family)
LAFEEEATAPTLKGIESMNCFSVVFKPNPHLSLDAYNHLIEAFIHNAIEANSLQFGGGGDRGLWKGVAESSDENDDQVSDAQLQAIRSWLDDQPFILDYTVSEGFESEPIDDEFVAKLENLVQAAETGINSEEFDRLFNEL